MPDKFVPEPTGPATRGARGNAGFESLTLSPDGARLFTAAETAVDAGWRRGDVRRRRRRRESSNTSRATTRSTRRASSRTTSSLCRRCRSRRRLASTAWSSCWRSTERRFLALERGYVEDKANPAQGRNRIRLFKISLTRRDGCLERSSRSRGRRTICPVDQDAADGSVRGQGAQPGAWLRVWTTSKAWRSARGCRTDGRRCSSSATTISASRSGRGSCSLRYSNGVSSWIRHERFQR